MGRAGRSSELSLVGDDAFVGRLLDESCGYGAEARLQHELTPCALRQAELPSDRAFSFLPRFFLELSEGFSVSDFIFLLPKPLQLDVTGSQLLSEL